MSCQNTSISGDIIIPSSYRGTKVLYIDSFFNCSKIESISIPNTITNIKGNSFSGCSELKTIYINDLNNWCKIKFGGTDYRGYYVSPFDNDFQYDLILNGKSITSLDIPEAITTIGDGTFWGCYKLKDINMSNNIASIGDYTFYGCSGLTQITLSDSITSIGKYTFNNCSNLTSITIPDSVTKYGEYILSRCTSLEYISIPFIYSMNYLFDGSRWGSFNNYVPESIKTVEITNAKNIESNSFRGCDSIETIILTDITTSIGNYAFKDCTSLINIYSLDSITSVGHNAFDNTPR